MIKNEFKIGDRVKFSPSYVGAYDNDYYKQYVAVGYVVYFIGNQLTIHVIENKKQDFNEIDWKVLVGDDFVLADCFCRLDYSPLDILVDLL